MTKPKAVICPYCGEAQATAERCRACLGLFEPLSRQATHNEMGPWFIRDAARPHQPGCSYETLVKLIERRQITKLSVLRGPTTKQFWTVARRVPGVAHLLGYCHACDASVDPADHGCHACGAPFGAYLDRNFMGLPEIRPLPWEPGYDERRDAAMMEAPPGMGALGASAWGRPGPGAGGSISSFASDAELLGGMTAPSSRAAGGGTMMQTSAAPAAVESGSSAQESGTLTTSHVTRSLQRRLARQQRTIRLLGAALIGLAIIVVAALLPRLAGVINAADPSANAPAKSAATNPSPAESTPPKPGGPAPAAGGVSQPQIIEQPAGQSPEPESPSPPSPDNPQVAPQPGAPEVKPAEDPHLAEYERAKILLIRAQDSDQTLDQRISDVTEAVEVLENVQRKLPLELHPPDLKKVLADARREQERLMLKKVMP